MSITGSLIIYVLIWWIIFFSLLPIDVDRKHKQIVEGIDKGSPENPRIIKKLIYTTIITSIIFIGIFMLVKYDYLNLRRFIS
jgi:predicted secreted protein|tara:strand:+ start:25 stop:270 length:246 start_codon:yes stop_codon:yes gene_type:complete